MKNGVNGMSSSAMKAGDVKAFCTASRSCCAAAGLRIPAGVVAPKPRRNTRSSRSDWNCAPKRARIRVRAKSSTIISAKSPATSTKSAVSVSSDREASTRS